MTSRKLRTVPFHGDEIVTFKEGSVHYVAMRRIVENIGLGWGAQYTKLLEQKDKFSCSDIETTGSDGKSYHMLRMPIEKLPLWLACINPKRVSEAVRPKLERYQAESAIALHDYWTKGVAIRGLDGLSEEVRKVIGGIVIAVVHREIATIVSWDYP